MSWLTRIAPIGLVCFAFAASSGCSTSETSEDSTAIAKLDAASRSPAESVANPSASQTTGQKYSAPRVSRNRAVAKDSKPRLDFYTVDHYDKKRNPADDLATTIERAKAEKKHILVQVGGDWCGWCKLMSHYIETTEPVRENIRHNYLIMKVTFDGEQTNEAFLSRYPPIAGYPHLFVLDWDGNLLHSQDTAELEEGHGYNDSVYLAFLDRWKPGRPGLSDGRPRRTPANNRSDTTAIGIGVEKPADAAPVAADAVISLASARQGDAITLTIRLRIAAGWHIYGLGAAARPAQPTTFSLTLPDGVTEVDEWTAPDPDREVTPLGISSVYQRDVEFSRNLKISDSVAPGIYDVVCKVSYQACDRSKCLRPASITVNTPLKIALR